MEQFSWKTTWELAEGFLYNQGCKKVTHVIGEEGKKSDQVGTCAPGRESEEKRKYTGEHSTWAGSGLSHRVGIPVLGS